MTTSWLTPERRMEHIVRQYTMRAVGVRRYDYVLLQSPWTVSFSMKALFSLHFAEEGSGVVVNLLKRWHLKVLDMGSGVDLDHMEEKIYPNC